MGLFHVDEGLGHRRLVGGQQERVHHRHLAEGERPHDRPERHIVVLLSIVDQVWVVDVDVRKGVQRCEELGHLLVVYAELPGQPAPP